jgi:hypothetical protein
LRMRSISSLSGCDPGRLSCSQRETVG